MQVAVRMFGGLTERIGASRVTVQVPDDATVATLRAALAQEHPSLEPLLARASVAVDLEVASNTDRLHPDAEVALLPPVAGGASSDRVDGRRVATGLRQPPFDVEAIVAEVSGPSVGGTVVFLGTVRDHAPDLDDVVALEYSAYPQMAERMLAQIADELVNDHPAVTGIALLHAVGKLMVGEHTVLIVCAAAHREAAFDACRVALEEVKERVPIWKREMTADGEARWVGLPDSAGPSPPAERRSPRDGRRQGRS